MTRVQKGVAFAVDKYAYLLWWILLFALLLRFTLALTVLQFPERAYDDDTASYIDFAKAISLGNGWDYPSAMRTPMYPLFLAGIISLFGEQAFPMIMAQVLVSTASVGITYKLAQSLFNEHIAAFAALLLALNVESITHSFYLLSETLFTFLFLLSAYFLLCARSEDSLKYLVLGGVFLGLSILTRPIAAYYPLLVPLILFWNQALLKDRLRNALIFLISCGMIVLPWVARNSMVLDLPVVSSISNHNLLYYNAASLLETYGEQNVNHELENRVEKMLVERGLTNTESSRTRIAGELGKQIILMDPVRYAILHLKSDIQGLYPDNSLPMILGIDISGSPLEILKQQGLTAAIQTMGSDYQDHRWVLAILLLLTMLLLLNYLGWILGTLRLLWKRQFFSLVFLSLPIFYQLFIPGDVSYARFRVPVMPFICILAAFGLAALKDRVQVATPKILSEVSM